MKCSGAFVEQSLERRNAGMKSQHILTESRTSNNLDTVRFAEAMTTGRYSSQDAKRKLRAKRIRKLIPFIEDVLATVFFLGFMVALIFILVIVEAY